MIPCSRRSTEQIKVFKVQYADSWGRAKWGNKKPEREEKEEEEGSGRKVGAGVKTPPRRRRSWRQAWRQDLRRQAWLQDLCCRAACQVSATSASSPRPRRQQQWRRAKGLDFEIVPPEIYLWKIFKKKGLKIKKNWGIYAATHTIHIFICPLT